ncbi:MAG: hypothetical protein M3072_14310 [Candidatus Dormibacteraeota bacterium]|nr:hypothetical protein [Candidatus Dormibacteraeota bacterium]
MASRRRLGLAERWEALSTAVQVAISFPLLTLLLFAANLGPFNQPVWRSILYGIFEGGVLTGLLLAATASERAKRRNPKERSNRTH